MLQYVLLGASGWQDFLARHTRVLERVGSVLAGLLLAAAAWGVTSS